MFEISVDSLLYFTTQASNDAPKFRSKILELIESFFFHITYVKRDIEMRTNFCTG